MENLDFSNIVQLMQPFIGKPIGLVDGSKFDKRTRTLLSVDAGFSIRYLCDGKELRTSETHSGFTETVKDFRFGGFSVKQIIELATKSEAARLGALRDALYSHKADIFLTCSDGRKVPAHKVVLASRSPVFDAMFTVEMQERNAPEVPMKEYSFEAVEAFVQLLYSKTPPKLKDHILEVIELADMYQIGGLDALIGIIDLAGILSCENAADVLFKAAERRQTGVWTAAFKFITENPVDIEDTESWKQMKRTGSTMDLDAQGLADLLKLGKRPKI